MLLDHARDYYKKGHKPTKRSIRRKFHLEIYNYFKDIGDYYNKAGIGTSMRYYPKNKARAIIINYIKKEAKLNRFPKHIEIEKKFKTHLRHYFRNINELYKHAYIDFSLVQKARKLERMHSLAVLNKQKMRIKELIRNSVKEGAYPSITFIQKKLNLSFYNLYKDIYEAYKAAGVGYERPSPILLGKKKEIVFTKIIKELILKMGFKIKRISLESKVDFNKNADMTIEDKYGKSYLIEIKAYRRDYRLSKREFSQLLNYLKKERISEGIFITTCNTKKCIFSNIQFINGDKVIELLKKYNLPHYIRSIRWVQESRVNAKERQRYLESKKKDIINYIKTKGYIPKKSEIEKVFKIELRSLFGEKPYIKLLKEAKFQVPSFHEQL